MENMPIGVKNCRINVCTGEKLIKSEAQSVDVEYLVRLHSNLGFKIPRYNIVSTQIDVRIRYFCTLMPSNI